MAGKGSQKFGWKRKIGAQVSKSLSTAFENGAKSDDDESLSNENVDWLHMVPIKKRSTVIGLEDGQAKAARLTQEGSVLAGSERYWEALKKWDEALLYTPRDERIHEMKAQVLMELCEVYPAVQAARKAVEYAPTWWIAHQTLGRALLGMGEVSRAVRSFSTAVHLHPEDRELWEDDLMWAHSLLQKRKRLDEETKCNQQCVSSGVQIQELTDNDEAGNQDSTTDMSSTHVECGNTVVDIYRNQSGEPVPGLDNQSAVTSLKRLPMNYVQMRDPLPP